MQEFYEDRVNSYKKFIENNPQKGILVNFKELKDQISLLDKIKNHFNLINSGEKYTIVNKIVTFNNTITNEIIRH